MNMIRLVLADDHPIVLAGLTRLLSLEADFDVRGTAANGVEALRLVRELRPDVLVLDLRMPVKDGLAVLREMASEKLATHVVVLTATDEGEVAEAIELGARGVMLKDMAPQLLVRCIREVAAGRRWVDRASATQTVNRLLQREAAVNALARTLTSRELEVARMVGKGMHNKLVAAKLSITEGTAKLHLHHVYEKLQVDGRLGLIRYLQSHGLN
jgi:two-component system, NarL family, nitrate/nitrite response regulator NarL